MDCSYLTGVRFSPKKMQSALDGVEFDGDVNILDFVWIAATTGVSHREESQE